MTAMFSADTLVSVELALRLAASVILVLLIGWDRETHRHPAGLRTHLLVALGACAFTIGGVVTAGGNTDPMRIAAQVVTGVGFLGAGAIWKAPSERFVHGLTTAASLWIAAAIGLLAGVGAYPLATVTAILAFGILRLRTHPGMSEDEDGRSNTGKNVMGTNGPTPSSSLGTAIDLHVHTTASSCGYMTPSEVVGHTRASGRRFLAITDHNTTSGAVEARTFAKATGDDLTVIVGMELSTADFGHVLVFGEGVEDDWGWRSLMPMPRNLPDGWLAIQAHPFRDLVKRALPGPLKFDLPDLPPSISAIERWNGNDLLSKSPDRRADLDEASLSYIAHRAERLWRPQMPIAPCRCTRTTRCSQSPCDPSPTLQRRSSPEMPTRVRPPKLNWPRFAPHGDVVTPLDGI